MQAVGVIPARWQSTRLPGKSLVPICGKPLIQWVLENARKAESLDALTVATDDRRIFDVATRLGAEAVMTREDHPSGTDRVAEAVEQSEADIVVNIQGDEPLLDPVLIDRLVDEMRNNEEWDMATAATPVTNMEDVAKTSLVKVVRDANGQALYFSRSVIPHIRDRVDQCENLYFRHLGIYAYRMAFLRKLVATPVCALERAEKLEQLRALYIGGKIAVLETDEPGIGVDTPQDVEYVESIMRKLRIVP